MTRTVPPVGFVMPATSLSAVLLPDPFRPMTPTVDPLATLNDTSLSAAKRFVRLQIAQEAALQQRTLQRRELPAGVPAVDLGDVDELDGGASHGLRERVTQAIEQPVAGEEDGDRPRPSASSDLAWPK